MNVSQEARIVVADLLDEVSSLLDHVGIGQVADLIRDGEYDEHNCCPIISAFEQSIRDKALEEAAGVAEDFDTWPMDGPAVRTNIAALIRQMKGGG